MITFIRNIHIKCALKIISLVLVGTMLLLLVCVAFLPAFISSNSAQSRIQQALSSSLKRRVAWSHFDLTWLGGLTLSGLTLGDGPAPLLKTNIDQIVIVPSFGSGVDGRFGIDLTVRIRNVRAELAPGPKKPPPPTKDPLTMLAESIQRIQKLDYALPVDLRVKVDAAPLNVVYRVPGKQLQLQDFSLRFAMPSLAAKPITAEVKGRVTVDGREMGNVSLNATVSDLVTNVQRIHLASALFAVEVAAPGTSVTLSGGLSQADGFIARLKLNLPGLLAVAHPFLSPAVPKLDGNIDVQLRAKTDTNNDLHAALTVDGTGLAASGGSLKAKRVGPLEVKLQQQIAADHKAQRVDFPGGSIAMPGLITAAWSASVNRPSVPERTLDITFGPLRIDLSRALAVAAPFIPPGMPVKDLAGEVFLRTLSLHLIGPKNQGDAKLSGFGITLPRVRMALKAGELTANNSEVIIETLTCPLSGNMPTKLTTDLLWSIRDAAISGTQSLSVRGARGKAVLAVTDLNLKSASPRKVSASATITQTFDLDRLSLEKRLTVENVHEQLRLLARAAENGDIEANLPEFSVTAGSMQGIQSGRKFGPIPLSASLTTASLRLPAVKGAKPSVQKASASVSAGDFLRITAGASLSGTSPQRAATSGTVQLDLKRALKFGASFVPSGMKADGKMGVVWDLAAPLPEKAPAFDKNPLRSARTGMALFDKLEFGVKLDNVSATVPSAKGEITVTGLRTGPDVRMYSTKNGDSAGIEGAVRFSGVTGLSGTAGKLPTQHGKLTFDGVFSGGNEFFLNEQLRIDPLAISQEAELSVSRIDALLDEKEPFNPATLIKRLDATLFATVDGAFSRELRQLLPGISVAGSVGSSTRIDLSAGRELALRSAVQTRDFDVRLANGTTVEGVRSDITFNRVYALAAVKGGGWAPLSAALIRPVAAVTANPGALEIAGRINEDLRGDIHGVRSFSIQRVTTKASGVPLELTALEGDLLFTQEKTGLSFFQADLLGGTLLARGIIDLLPEIPAITTAGSFSNLDITYLLPKDAGKQRTNQNAEITGEMSFTAPLTTEQRELFEQLRLALNVRKIGADMIERALFALDPYERNEQVVAQRKMLRLGGLKGLRARAVDGAFSMEGEAYIKGVEVELPKVERLRISELPLRQELQKNKAGIMALRGLLDLVRADTLIIGPKGELSLKRRIYAQ